MTGEADTEWQECGEVTFGLRQDARPALAPVVAKGEAAKRFDRGIQIMATTLSRGRATTAIRAGRPAAGVLLVICAAQFMTVIMLAASMAPAYDLVGGAISDLGTIAETALLFNVSLVAVGVLTFAAGLLYHRSHRRASVLAVFVLAAIGAAGAGLGPLDVSGLHGIFALVAFAFFNILPLAVATTLHGPMRWVSIAAGIVGLAFVALMVAGDAGNPGVFGAIGHGGAERMIVYPPMLWMLVFGGYLLGSPGDDASVA